MAIEDYSDKGSFGKAFAAARRKHLKGDGAATFTYKGKRYNVQTKEDRKTTVKKIPSGKSTREKTNNVKKRGLTLSEARSAGITGPGIRSKRKAVTDSETALKEAKSADAKSEASKIRRAQTIVGGALALAGPGRAAVTKTASALKRVGGGKGVGTIIKKTASAVKKESDARKGGFGKFERSPVGELKKQIKTQQTVTKTKATKAATKARKAAEADKKQKAAQNRKNRRTATSTAETFGRGMKNVRRARGGVFKGQF